jgi:hypothetical protein
MQGRGVSGCLLGRGAIEVKPFLRSSTVPCRLNCDAIALAFDYGEERTRCSDIHLARATRADLRMPRACMHFGTWTRQGGPTHTEDLTSSHTTAPQHYKHLVQIKMHILHKSTVSPSSCLACSWTRCCHRIHVTTPPANSSEITSRDIRRKNSKGSVR